MWYWIGAGVVLLLSVPCGITLGARVGKGEARAWNVDTLVWYGYHGATGLLALWLVTKATG